MIERLRHRADFLAAARGAKAPAGGFVLQARARGKAGPARIGFTISRRVGTAVERNRVRRRLREAVRLSLHDRLRRGHDYVVIGRRAALELPFERLVQDFIRALGRVHGNAGAATPHAGAR